MRGSSQPTDGLKDEDFSEVPDQCGATMMEVDHSHLEDYYTPLLRGGCPLPCFSEGGVVATLPFSTKVS